MRAIVRRRERIARVRRFEHVQAAGEVVRAEGRVTSLETSASRLGELRISLTPMPGRLDGAALAHAGELAMRLEAARDGLTDAIVGARANVVKATAERVLARIAQESAERLGERAGAAWAEQIERRQPAGGRGRRSLQGEDA